MTAGTKGIRVAINPLQCRLVLTEVPAFASHYSQPVLINLFALSLHTRLKRAMNPRCAFRATSIYFHNDTPLEKCHSLTTLNSIVLLRTHLRKHQSVKQLTEKAAVAIKMVIPEDT